MDHKSPALGSAGLQRLASTPVRGALRSCAIVNTGPGSWVFEEHAERLARATWLDVTEAPADYVYLLGWEGAEPPQRVELFIPYASILLASDKRRLAQVFAQHGVATPPTYLLESPEDVRRVVRRERDR